MKGPTEKGLEYLKDPKQIGRDLEDLGDAIGDVVHDRGAREIYPREIGKSVSRTVEDMKENWENLLPSDDD